MNMALVVGLIASLIGLAATIPQVIRARRTSVDGLSWGSQLLTLSTCTIWAVYGLFIFDGIQIFNNAAALILNGLLVAAIVAAQPTRRPAQALGVIVATALAAVLVAWLINPLTVGMIGSVIGSVRLVPQLRLALTGQPLWGLDPWAVQLALGSSFIWLAYGLFAADIAVISSAGLAVLMNTTICARRLPPRRTLRSIADGRIGPHAARAATPVATLVRAPANPGLAQQAAAAA
jgi:uncharacterized protein with PQ loop repeat